MQSLSIQLQPLTVINIISMIRLVGLGHPAKSFFEEQEKMLDEKGVRRGSYRRKQNHKELVFFRST